MVHETRRRIRSRVVVVLAGLATAVVMTSCSDPDGGSVGPAVVDGPSATVPSGADVDDADGERADIDDADVGAELAGFAFDVRRDPG